MAAKKMSSVYVSWPKPDFAATVKTNKHFRRNFHGAMLYIHYEMTTIELKREVVKYLKAQDPKHPMLERIKDMHENRFATIGKYIYLLNHGCDIPEDILPKVEPALETVVYEEEQRQIRLAKEAGSLTEEVTTPKYVVSIQDRIRERASEVAGEIEGWIDDFCLDRKINTKTVEDFVNLFKSNELKAPHVRYVQLSFQRRAQELADAVSGKDKELIEAYSNFTKPELKKCDAFCQNLLKACAMMQEVAKVERAPRKKKPVSTDKLVAKLKYKKEDKELGLVSLNPVQIIGAKALWLYNTKTRKLSEYKAEDDSGFSVKGAGLLNYSPKSAEKTLRKPIEALAEFKKASKVKLRTFLAELTTMDTLCNGKLNEHHIILRIDK